MNITLNLSQAEFEQLYEASDNSATTVKVKKEALQRLLMDHTQLVAALKGANIKFKEPRHREKL